MPFIVTFTGKRFQLLEPTPDMIDIRDIAHSLARICRFNGHTREHYSVAQHSILVADSVPGPIRLEALLHDAAEAYIGDITSPLKRFLGPALKSVERNIEAAVAKHFGTRYGHCSLIKSADLRALATERRDLLAYHPEPWPMLNGVEPFTSVIEPCSIAEAETEFLEAYRRLART